LRTSVTPKYGTKGEQAKSQHARHGSVKQWQQSLHRLANPLHKIAAMVGKSLDEADSVNFNGKGGTCRSAIACRRLLYGNEASVVLHSSRCSAVLVAATALAPIH
jgi:hypothetical protein